MIYPPPIRLPYRLLQIGDKVLRVFEADRKAQQALVDSQLVEYRPRNRTVRLHERIRYEALRAAKALREENEPHALEHRQRAFVRVDLERHHCAEARCLPAGQPVVRVIAVAQLV